jgi:hypothetical protein
MAWVKKFGMVAGYKSQNQQTQKINKISQSIF